MTCILATNNAGKARELRALFACNPGDAACESQLVSDTNQLTVVSLAELGLAFTPGEDGGTFVANATQKAVETAAFLRKNAEVLRDGGYTMDSLCVLADDSGLVIDALDGEPGVDSALYLGVDTPFAVRNAHILERLREVPDGKRTARFVCVAACCLADGSVVTAMDTLEGVITREATGSDGFGYDPIFFVPEYGKTLAQLTVEQKNIISHRGKAMRAMKAELRNCPARKLQAEPAISFLITSDTHEDTTRLEALLKHYDSQVQGVFHLGDHDYDLLQYEGYSVPFYTVAGNCDDGILSPRERVVTIGGRRIFMAHGDRFNVGSQTDRLLACAQQHQAAVCLFGHTHIPTCATVGGILLMNPGSLTSPRDNGNPSYGLLTLNTESNTFSGEIIRA